MSRTATVKRRPKSDDHLRYSRAQVDALLHELRGWKRFAEGKGLTDYAGGIGDAITKVNEHLPEA